MTASAVPVATEVLFLADVSGSLDGTDFALQRDGYANAFLDPGVINAITTFGPIAASLVYWADSQSVAVGWTMISDAASAAAFSAAISAAPRPFSGGTEMADAMNFGTASFAGNGFEGSQLVMDVSGDGADSTAGFSNPNALNVQAARDNALASGVDTINALWIDDRDFFGDDPADTIDALQYGVDNVIAGASPFQSIVDDFSDFEAAIISKIEREVVPPQRVPDAGSSAVLLGLGFLGMAFNRRRSA